MVPPIYGKLEGMFVDTFYSANLVPFVIHCISICAVIQEMPKWYSYDHDVLLMELVLHNGLDTDQILVDLEGENRSSYKTRLRSEESNTWDDPYYEFKTWAKSKWNVLHRLKYVTDTVVRALYKDTEEFDYSGSGFQSCSVLFIEYQRRTHTEFLVRERNSATIKREEWEEHALESREIDLDAHHAKHRRICCNGIFSRFSGEATRQPHTPRQKSVPRKRVADDMRSPLMPTTYSQLSAAEEEEESSSGLEAGSPHKVNFKTPQKGRSRPNLSLTLDLTDASFHMNNKIRKPGKVRKNSTLLGDQWRRHIDDGRMRAMSVQLVAGAHKADPFVERDIDAELRQSLQSCNLKVYGRPLAKLIISQMQRERRKSHVIILGELMHALPYQNAIDIIKDQDTQDLLCNLAEPIELEEICQRLIDGASVCLCSIKCFRHSLAIESLSLITLTQFGASAALLVAEFFDDLAAENEIREEIWDKISTHFEKKAYDFIGSVENDHLLFVLLNIPLVQHGGKSLCELALDERRTEFLNNDRVNSLTWHLYEKNFLKPEEEINMKRMSKSDMLKMLLCHPFEFYFMPMGYHYIEGILFLLYMLCILLYAWHRPIGGEHHTWTGWGYV